MTYKLNKTGKGLLAYVDDVIRCHLEIFSGQLKSKGHGDAQIAVSIIIKATGSFIQNICRSTDSVRSATVFGNLAAGTQRHLMQEAAGGCKSISERQEIIV